ncbi:sensor histidine kinase [Caulobacter sp. 602-1]|uniref:sensor histidine kinase n=1 Tax=Caulobacter sp. 602-1 TaxID=2492472 RepID=UPI001F34AA63|nr:sensor histidine kinase [Caulobacter sp. 602-1]
MMVGGLDLHGDAFAGAGWADQRVNPSIGITGLCDECNLIAEADHRIANHLSLLAGFVRLKALDLARQPLESVEPASEAVQMLLENIRAQIEAVARLHRSFARGGSGASADLSEHLHEICGALGSIFSGRIEVVEDLAAGCRIMPDQALPLAQIIAEVITNAIKHAYPPDETGRVLVRSRKDPQGSIVIEVADDGPGLSDTFNAATDGGLGFRLIRELGKQIGAALDFDSSRSGLMFRLRLPLITQQHLR